MVPSAQTTSVPVMTGWAGAVRILLMVTFAGALSQPAALVATTV